MKSLNKFVFIGGGVIPKRNLAFLYNLSHSSLKILSVFLLSIFLVMGCGGGSSDNSGTNTGDNINIGGGSEAGSNGGNTGSKTISGKVIYKYNDQSAEVCADKNGDNACGDGDIRADVNQATGEYTINLTQADFLTKPLIAVIYDKSSVNGRILANETAGVAKPVLVFNTPLEKTNISSLTTIIKSQMDQDTSLTIDEAEEKVRLSMNLDEAEDLFNPTSEIETLANKLAEAVKGMFKKLADDFGIEIRQSTILLVMNEVVSQLSAIAKDKTADDVVKDAMGIKDKETAEANLAELGQITTPAVKTVAEFFANGFQGYGLGKDAGNNPLYWSFFNINKSSVTQTANDNAHGMKLPIVSDSTRQWDASVVKNEDGSATVINWGGKEGFNAKFLKIETKALNGIRLSPNINYKEFPEVLFSEGAEMYKLPVYADEEEFKVDVETIKEANTPCGNNYRCDLGDIKSVNDSLVFDGNDYKIIMRKDKTYIVKHKSEGLSYSGNMGPYAQSRPMRKGTYSKTDNGDIYTFMGEGNITVFKIFKMTNGKYRAAGYMSLHNQDTFVLFNKIAAEDITRAWNNSAQSNQ